LSLVLFLFVIFHLVLYHIRILILYILIRIRWWWKCNHCRFLL